MPMGLSLPIIETQCHLDREFIVSWSVQQKAAFFEGSQRMSRAGFAILTWALVTGVAMAGSGISLAESIGMSLLVFAGSAQLAALPLILGNFPIWTIWLTAIVVNLRFVIASAAIQPHFKDKSLWQRFVIGYLNGDLTFAFFISRYPVVTADSCRLPFYLGMSLTNWTIWQTGSILGILLSSFIPEGWGLGFAGTLALIGIVMPMIESKSAKYAAGSAAAVAIIAVSLPYKLNLILAILTAVIVGMATDKQLMAKKQRSEV